MPVYRNWIRIAMPMRCNAIRIIVNSMYTFENSLRPFYNPKIYSIISIPLKFQLDSLHASIVTFSFISLLSLVTNIVYALYDVDLNISLKNN